MIRARVASVLACAIAAFTLAPSAAGAQTPDALLGRMAALNPRLHSYTASVHADVHMLTFPYLSPSLDGTYYHRDPDRNKLVFTSGVPAMASQFSRLYPQVESPSQWRSAYTISVESSSGGTTTLRLVPRRRGRVDHIDARVDDRTATVAQMRWNYADGGYATLNQHYTRVAGNYLVDRQSGHVEMANYTVDVTSSFSNFKLNPRIPDSVFEQ